MSRPQNDRPETRASSAAVSSVVSSAETRSTPHTPMTPMTTMRRYGRLARAADEGLEALATFAASALSMQVAAIGLLDERRQWFSATIGGGGLGERLSSFLAFGLLSPRGVEIPDLAADAHFAAEPLVQGEPGFRSLVARRLEGDEGGAVGVLLLLDLAPKRLDARGRELLDQLAAQARAALSIRRELRALREKHRLDLASLELLDGVLRASSGVGIVGLDLTGRVTVFNRGAERLFGERRGDVVGARTLFDLLARGAPAARGGEKSTVEALAADGPVEWTVGPQARPVSLEIEQLANEEAEATGWVVVAHDLTEKKAADALRREALSITSHELRTPLTSILGALRLVSAGVTGALPGEADDMIRIARDNAERLGRLVDDLLDLQKVEAGHADLRIERCELGALLGKALVQNQSYAEPLGVELRLAPALPRVDVDADPDRLLQVLANLISNAAKVSPRGAVVELDLAILDAEEGRARVSIRDHGPGIPNAFRPRIFQRFAQATAGSIAPPPEGRLIRGSGLGLSIVRALVEAHGGVVGFDTELGRGTTFWFELPRAR
jgi:signal transduction histidine kinase